MPEFVYQEPFPVGADATAYRKLEGSEKYVRVERFAGREPFSRWDPPVLRDYLTFYALAEARSAETNASMDEVAGWYRKLVDQLDQVAEHLWSTHGQ